MRKRWRTGVLLEAPGPLPEAARTNQAHFVESPEQWHARWPGTLIPALGVASQAFALLPLSFDGKVLGALALSFSGSARFRRTNRRS